jgi:hypothetical protein
MHPLAPNLTDLSDAELMTKHADLKKKLMQAYRMGPASIVQQLQMLDEDYTREYNNRQAKLLESMQKDNPDFNGTIDIN